MPQPRKNQRVIFDVLYGFVPITEWEEKIIDTPFFQRLRWIKQLGFANYIFPGAEHNRFAHVIGVMHSMDQMIQSLGIGLPDAELFDPNVRPTTQNLPALLHKSLRMAALLHDIGTFPFSHAIEYGYIRHGNDHRRTRKSKSGQDKSAKALPNSHEHLGSFIIKNTRYPGGITHILESYGFDVQLISDIIKGESPYLIANQLMHSDLDADRMDYLLRDSHYTGIKYGQFDRDYILANLMTFDVTSPSKTTDLQQGFGVRENGLHALEDFLIARFNWYSQVIKHPGSAKFDIMSSHITRALLENDLLYQFNDLLEMIESRDDRFFWWNDLYFMTRCQEVYHQRQIKDRRVLEQIEMLLFRKPPRTLKNPLFEHRIMSDRGEGSRGAEAKRELISKLERLKKTFLEVIEEKGTGREWILFDLPEKDIVFTKPLKQLLKKSNHPSDHYTSRDPVKIVSKTGAPSLLVERDHTLMKHLSGFVNFVPNVYANDAAYHLLKKHGHAV